MKEAWKTLRLAIPEQAAPSVAKRLHLNPDYVGRWRRPPATDEAPSCTGQRSILDRFDDFMVALFLVNPIGPSFVIEHLRFNLDEMLHARLDPNYWDRREHAASTLLEVAEAVNCLNLDANDDETLKELFEARQYIDLAIKNIQSRRGADGSRKTLGATESAGNTKQGFSGRLPGGAAHD